MTVAVLAALLAMIFSALGVAKMLAVPRMRAAAAHAGLGIGRYRAIGAIELATAMGILTGLRWPTLGVITTVGVLLLMAGAVRVHARAGDPVHRWLPAAGTAALAITYGVLVSGAAS